MSGGGSGGFGGRGRIRFQSVELGGEGQGSVGEPLRLRLRFGDALRHVALAAGGVGGAGAPILLFLLRRFGALLVGAARAGGGGRARKSVVEGKGVGERVVTGGGQYSTNKQ